jgi:hypothetical protein
VQAGGGSVQFAPVGCAHNVERDALTPVPLFLLFIDFFYDPHFSVAAPPNGGRCAARRVKAARNDLAVRDRNAPVLHANRRFYGFLHCHPNESRVTVSHDACLWFILFMFMCLNELQNINFFLSFHV